MHCEVHYAMPTWFYEGMEWVFTLHHAKVFSHLIEQNIVPLQGVMMTLTMFEPTNFSFRKIRTYHLSRSNY